MQTDWSTDEPSPAAGQLWVVPVRKDDDPSRLSKRFGAHVQTAAEAARFAGKPSEGFSFTREVGGTLHHVVLLGVGVELGALGEHAHRAV